MAGVGMTVLVIVHQLLNRKWYGTLFKGKYSVYRADCVLRHEHERPRRAVSLRHDKGVLCAADTPFHVSMSHWGFVLMGLHLDFHIPAMTAKLDAKTKKILTAVFCVAAGIELSLFLRSGMADYMLFCIPFAFLDYDKATAQVFFESLLMLLFWAFIGTELSLWLRGMRKKDTKGCLLIPPFLVMASLLFGLVLNLAIPANSVH